MSFKRALFQGNIEVGLGECFRKPVVLNKNNDNETVEELEYIPIENTEKDLWIILNRVLESMDEFSEPHILPPNLYRPNHFGKKI